MACVLAATYLAAAFLPCAASDARFLSAEASPATSSKTHSMLESPSIVHAGHPERSESAPQHPASHDGHGSHGVHVSDASDTSDTSETSDPHAEHRMASRHGTHSVSETSSSDARLEFVPTCLCGCSKTRAQIGGGAGRLGSVVPGVVIARLVEAERVPFRVEWPARPSELHFDIDPIPV